MGIDKTSFKVLRALSCLFWLVMMKALSALMEPELLLFTSLIISGGVLEVKPLGSLRRQEHYFNHSFIHSIR